MIDIKQLTESDRGRRVRYSASHITEWGTIRRWNDRYIFVLYTKRQFNGGQVVDRTGSTAEATDPRNLEFVE